MTQQKKTFTLSTLAIAVAVWMLLENARAVEIEPMGKALVSLLKTSQGVVRKTVKVNGQDETLFMAKGRNGHPTAVAFIEKGLYPPNCTHTWAIGIDPQSGKVTAVRVIEMACPHAFPTRTASFLDQYKGKGPADVATLDAKIDTVAKATGSCKLATQAVKRSITAYSQIRRTL